MHLPIFPKVPRAIAIDLDGTLLDSQTRLSPRSRSALQDCLEIGIPIIIATSRPARIFNRIFTANLAGRVSLVIMNGAVAVGRPPLGGYFKDTLPEKVFRKIIDVALKFDSHIRITLELDYKDTICVVPALLSNPLLNITARQASKPSALRKLLDPVGISLEEVAAFGDDIPDVEMLQECGISLAMANAFPEVKSVCKYLTASK